MTSMVFSGCRGTGPTTASRTELARSVVGTVYRRYVEIFSTSVTGSGHPTGA